MLTAAIAVVAAAPGCDAVLELNAYFLREGATCSESCNGVCESCAQGQCLATPAGEVADGECADGETCDGLRGCHWIQHERDAGEQRGMALDATGELVAVAGWFSGTLVAGPESPNGDTMVELHASNDLDPDIFVVIYHLDGTVSGAFHIAANNIASVSAVKILGEDSAYVAGTLSDGGTVEGSIPQANGLDPFVVLVRAGSPPVSILLSSPTDQDARGLALWESATLEKSLFLVGAASAAGMTLPCDVTNAALSPDAFVVQIRDDLSQIEWCSVFGTTGEDAASAVAVGDDGRPVIAGWYSDNSDIMQIGDLTLGAPVGPADRNVFVAKLVPKSTDAVWAVSLSSEPQQPDWPVDLLLDGSGNAVVSGVHHRASLTLTDAASQTPSSLATSIDETTQWHPFVTKLDGADGTPLAHRSFTNPDVWPPEQTGVIRLALLPDDSFVLGGFLYGTTDLGGSDIFSGTLPEARHLFLATTSPNLEEPRLLRSYTVGRDDHLDIDLATATRATSTAAILGGGFNAEIVSEAGVTLSSNDHDLFLLEHTLP